MQNMKRYIFIPVFAVTAFLLILWALKSEFFPPRFFLSYVAPAANETVFYLSPESGNYTVNSAFSISIHANTSAAITSVRAYLNFNSSLLSVTNIDTSGSVFSNWWESSSTAIGKIQLQASTPSPGVSGDGVVAVITFRALGPGTAVITYDPVSLVLRPDDTNILNLVRSTGASFVLQAADATPPFRSGGQPSVALPAGTNQTVIFFAP